MTAQPERDAGAEATSTVRRVALHVVRCNTCRHAVESIGDEADVTGFLEAQRDVDDTPVIERVFGTVAKVGTGALADLVYELARAMFFANQDFSNYVVATIPPRNPDAIGVSMGALVDRLDTINDLNVAAACRTVDEASHAATEADRRVVGWSALRMLGALEDMSARAAVLASHAHICAGDAARAVGVVQPIFESESVDVLMRSKAAIALSRAFMILDRYDDLDRVVSEARRRGCSRPIIELYGVASTVARGDVSQAREQLRSVDDGGHAWSSDEVERARHLTRYIADGIGVDVNLVANAIGAA